MTVLDVLRHQWRRRWRSYTRGRNLLATLLLLLAAVYFGLLFVGMGWFYPQVVAEVAPSRDPLRLLNEFLLHGFGGLVVSRFFLQRSAGSDVQGYLPLPIQRLQLVRVMQVTSALSLFTLLPVVALATLWESTVLPSASVAGAVCWGVGVLLTVALTQSANSLLRAAWDRNVGLVLGVAGLLAAIVVLSSWMGMAVVRETSGWLFGGLAAQEVGPLLVLIGGTVGTAGAAHGALRARLYDVPGETERTRSSSGGLLLGKGKGRGRVASLALLEAKLILRNKRPRQMMLTGLVTFPFFLFLVAEEGTSPLEHVFFGFLLSGYLGLTYSQFGYAWHGSHFDGLLALTVSLGRLVQAQLVTFVGLCTGPLALTVPIIAWLRPQLLAPLGGFFLYNVGVTAPFLLGLGVWTRTALQLDQSAFFNYQGTSSHLFLVVLSVMGLPIGLWTVLGTSWTLIVVAGLGLVGIATVPLWTRGVGTLLHRRRHALAAGFRETD